MIARLLGALRARLGVIERRWISDAAERAVHQEVVTQRLSTDAAPDRPTARLADSAER
jgi:hypothetical protein